MLISDGYVLHYSKPKNEILIKLPRTWETIRCTTDPVGDRRTDVEEVDLFAVLNVVRLIFEKRAEERRDDRSSDES